MNKKKIYFAGKIECNDWRHSIVPGLRGGGYWNRRIWNMDDNKEILQLDDDWYVGPFFISDDHRCGHGKNTHGVGNEENVCFQGPKRKHVFDKCIEQISVCDYIFCWLDSKEAYGTLFELGVAFEKKKRIFLAIDEKLKGSDDFWFTKQSCWYTAYFDNHNDAWKQFQKMIKDEKIKESIE